MRTTENENVTVETLINAPVEKVWELWTDPKHIIHWNYASDDWHSPHAENDLRTGGRFVSRMEAKDGSIGFDFSGQYIRVEKHKIIEYNLDDNRKVKVTFASEGNQTKLTEIFEAEQSNPVQLQKEGWQAILDNFRKYAEASGKLEPLHFEIEINSDVEKVYQTMLDENTYKEWTAEFNPTSKFVGSWDKGSEIRFLGTDKDGNVGGMLSRIRENIPNNFVSIEHVGMIHGDREITSGAEVDGWAGALENYTFRQVNGSTLLSVDIDVNQEFKSYFIETWPKALKKLKSICEAKN